MADSFARLEAFRTPVQVLLTDIDDTLTDEGLLGSEAFEALWTLHRAGLQVVPVTGRPAGWCEMIARQWPVAGVVGENGAFYFRYDRENRKMKRHFVVEEGTRAHHRVQLKQLEKKILLAVPGCAVASDQFCRISDLAIDFCEDVPRLPWDQVEKIRDLFTQAGAQARISSIHVNGWFGEHDKLSESLVFLKSELGLAENEIQSRCAFVGDSPNDEPMWRYFTHSFGVANIKSFAAHLRHPPKYVTRQKGGSGFAELARHLLTLT